MSGSAAIAYVDASIEQLRRLGLMLFPGTLPEAMRDPTIPLRGKWTGWRPMASTVSDSELDLIEIGIGLPLPTEYRSFLKYKHFFELTERGLRFERHLPDQWAQRLHRLYFAQWGATETIIGRKYIPFGSESFMDAGPVCFDANKRSPDGDYPVVFLDHERFGRAGEVRPLFSSCVKMFESLAMFAREDLNFSYHSPRDDPGLLPRKRELMAQFLLIDPEGAGGLARAHWTGWGVNPEA